MFPLTVNPALLAEASRVRENALTILKARYLRKDADGTIIETPEELFHRVASTVAAAEETNELQNKYTDEFYVLMANNYFLPNSPTLMNAGNLQGTLSACFVVEIEDTMEGILEAAKTAGVILKYGGGIGFYLGKLRPKGSPIKSTHGRACGPVAVLKHLNSLSIMITQGGKREAANMAGLPISHPDIREFIHCKDENDAADSNNQALANFNISVIVSDEFMSAVKNGDTWQTIDPHTKQSVESFPARDLFEEIVESAWRTGDPGFFFVDTANKRNPTPQLGELHITNPCGEVPLYPNEACNIGSLNLTRFYSPDSHKEDGLDWQTLDQKAKLAVRFLDDTVTVNTFPKKEITKAVHRTRKIGLGVMGWADLLILLRIPYNSEEAVQLATKLMAFIQNSAATASEDLAKERGCYPAWKGSYHEEVGQERRNATVTCIAPTGTLGRLAGVSTGIEPLIALAYSAKILGAKTEEDAMFEMNPILEEIAPEHVLKSVSENGHLHNVEWEDNAKASLLTALEIEPEWHIKHQAAFQRFTDLAVSKTINLPNSVIVEDIREIFMLAWHLGCKGTTVFRDGCRQAQALTKPAPVSIDAKVPLDTPELKSLPWKTQSVRYKIPTPSGINLYVQLGIDVLGLVKEIILNLGKSGTDIQADLEALGRIISIALRYGVPIQEIHKQLIGIHSGRTTFFMGRPIVSTPDAIALAIQDYRENADLLNGGENSIIDKDDIYPMGYAEYCPDCKLPLVHEEGCMRCINPACDFTRC